MTATYKTNEHQRASSTQRYIEKRGDAYRSHEERRRDRAEQQARKATDRLARDLRHASEAAYGQRQCSSCGETLPLTTECFSISKLSRHGLRTDCRACHSGHESWSAREKLIASRKAAKDAKDLAKAEAQAEREQISLVKNTPEWKEAQRSKHKACEMLPLYTALTSSCWRAWGYGLSNSQLAVELEEIVDRHNRRQFMEMHSEAFRMAAEGKYEQMDAYDMAHTWEALEDRWNGILRNSLDTMDELLAA